MKDSAEYRIRAIPFPVLRRFRSKAAQEGLSVRDALVRCMMRYSEEQDLVSALKDTHQALQTAITSLAQGAR